MVGRNDEQKRALERLIEHGWTIQRETGKGYLQLTCGCGGHLGRLHKTPSDPNHYRHRADFLIRQCSTLGRRVR
jgi:hypothetical protein